MIKYILKCKNKHEFESWFASSSEFEKLRKKKLLECISCTSSEVEKSIMSPNVLNSDNKESEQTKKEFIKIKKNLLKIRKFVEKNFEFVGNRFPQEVRDIHYNKDKKNIYGIATSEEREELKEEGIELETIPWVKKEN
jgi:hypothetical protein